MLSYLSIRNFALIENCELHFSGNLNIITGETGTGKSIIIQALAILLGGRASVEHIRTGSKEATLNAEIQISGQKEIKDFLDRSGITYEEDLLLLRRILTASGKSRSYINGAPVTSRELSFISGQLFDFHGQHEGVSLLRKKTHITYLDNYLELDREKKELASYYKQIKTIEAELADLDENERDKQRRMELISHEIDEITASGIKAGEEEALTKEIRILENAEKLTENLNELCTIFESDTGVLSKLKSIRTILASTSQMDSAFEEMNHDISDVFYKFEDYAREIKDKLAEYEYNPAKLDSLIERLEMINDLKRKYGTSYEDIMEYLKKSKQELKKIQFSEELREKNHKALDKVKNEYARLAAKISEKRKAGAAKLEEAVKKELQALGMENVEFTIEVKQAEDNLNFVLFNNKQCSFSLSGIDQVEFLISPNMGEPLKSLIKIASGGELSRIILSLKTVLAKNDSVATMIFDEIDVGIGGKVALAVGKTLKDLSKEKQILCITHLPQIAAGGDCNFTIHKEVSGDRTVTNIVVLDDEGKITEVARMLSGSKTETSLKHAGELIETVER